MSAEGYEHFKTLGVTVNATDEEIKKAYRKKARDVHPDRNASAEAHEVFIKLKKAYDFLCDGGRRLDIREDVKQAQKTAEKYANRQRGKPSTSRFSAKPETPEIKLKLIWNAAKDKYTVRHLKKALKAEDVREEGPITCANGAAYAIFKSDEDALDGHIAAMQFKPKPIKVEWISAMPKIARDLLDDTEDCVIVEPKKPKKRKKEKSKYDAGFYAEQLKREKREADYDRQWARRATK